jgi:hypothetical protein
MSAHAQQLMSTELFDDACVHALKGLTKNVSRQQHEQFCLELEASACCVLKDGSSYKTLVTMWDGDSIELGSFTGGLIVLGEWFKERKMQNFSKLCEEGRVKFVYAMASCSPYETTPPRGIDMMQATFGEENVKSIVAGVDTGIAAETLFDDILTLNSTMNDSTRLSSDEHYTFITWVKSSVDEICGNDTHNRKLDEHDRFSSEMYGSYGYLLLGLAFAHMARPYQITFSGMGLVSKAENAYHVAFNQDIICSIN